MKYVTIEDNVAIDKFRGEYAFLSNFYPCEFWFDNVLYKSSEHFYMSMKTDDPELRQRIIDTPNAYKAKKLGSTVQLVENWKDKKFNVMCVAVHNKFIQNPHLAQMLLDTGDIELVENNTWHDNVWGNCVCGDCKFTKGQNHLGSTLMRMRDYLNQK